MPLITARLGDKEHTQVTLNTEEISTFQQYRCAYSFGPGTQTLVRMKNGDHFVLDESYDDFAKKLRA